MNKNLCLFLIIVGSCTLGCNFNRKTESLPPPKSYPEEVNFLRSMAIGDTVFLFIKASGYFQPYSNQHIETHLTCYTRQEICRVDSFLYKSREFYLTPSTGTQWQGGLNFEFDTVKFDLQKALKACNSLEPFCVPKQDQPRYSMGNECLWRQPGWYGGKTAWLNFTTLGMSDPMYNEWRFTPPSYSELKAWRSSMNMNNQIPERKFEVLSFYKDTCKISYCNDLPTQYPFDFSKMR
jgi:hypothetical protein